MTRAGRAAAVAAIALAAACGGAGEERRRAGAEPELRIWNPIVVWWDPGRPRHVDFAIENPTRRTLAIAAPDPANARVDVFSGPDSIRVCGVAPAERPAPGARVALAPGDRVAVRVDLGAACGAVPPGSYRYEVSYRATAPAAGESAFSGTLPVRYGQVVVSAPATSGEALSRDGGAEAPPERPARRQSRAATTRGGRGRGPATADPPPGARR